MRLQVVLLAFLSVLLSACSAKCERGGIAGVYGADYAQNSYELRLSEDGSGSLIEDHVEIGLLEWELEPSIDQVFLHSDRKVLEVLRRITDARAFPNDTAKWQSGYRGVTPECGLDGLAKRLDLDVDGLKYLSRRAH